MSLGSEVVGRFELVCYGFVGWLIILNVEEVFDVGDVVDGVCLVVQVQVEVVVGDLIVEFVELFELVFYFLCIEYVF